MEEGGKYSELSNPEVLRGLGDSEEESGSQRSQFQQPKSNSGEERRWQWAFPQIEGVPPCPRGGHSATLIGNSLMIFGGHYFGGKKEGFVYLNDVSVLDVNENRWYKPRVNGTPPQERYGHTAIVAGGRMVVFGGRGEKGVHFRDLHALDPNTMTWYQGPEGGNAPSGRLNHTANLVGSRMFVFGGWNGTDFFNDVGVLDLVGMAWSSPETSGPSPTPRMGHVSEVVGTNLIVQGGFYFNSKQQRGMRLGSMLKDCYLNDLKVLDTESMTWSRLRISGTPPVPSYGHSMNISAVDVVVFGGYAPFKPGTEKNCEYLTVLNTETMTWQKPQYKGVPPPPRQGHTCTLIETHLLIFGGWESTKAMNDVVVLRDLSAFSKQK